MSSLVLKENRTIEELKNPSVKRKEDKQHQESLPADQPVVSVISSTSGCLQDLLLHSSQQSITMLRNSIQKCYSNNILVSYLMFSLENKTHDKHVPFDRDDVRGISQVHPLHPSLVLEKLLLSLFLEVLLQPELPLHMLNRIPSSERKLKIMSPTLTLFFRH